VSLSILCEFFLTNVGLRDLNIMHPC